jgi:hypothetical protein
VLHHSQLFGAEVLGVASAAVLNVGVKSRGLTLQDIQVIGMASDALGGIDPFKRRVAGGAVVFQKGVRRRQHARTDEMVEVDSPDPRRIGEDACDDPDEGKSTEQKDQQQMLHLKPPDAEPKLGKNV